MVIFPVFFGHCPAAMVFLHILKQVLVLPCATFAVRQMRTWLPASCAHARARACTRMHAHARARSRKSCYLFQALNPAPPVKLKNLEAFNGSFQFTKRASGVFSPSEQPQHPKGNKKLRGA